MPLAVAFTLLITTMESPITRKGANALSDWSMLVWAVALFGKQVFIAKHLQALGLSLSSAPTLRPVPCAQVHFVLILGVGPCMYAEVEPTKSASAQSAYNAADPLLTDLYDPFNGFEICASIATVGALVLGVCNEEDWPVAGEAPSLSQASTFTFAFPFVTGECLGSQVLGAPR